MRRFHRLWGHKDFRWLFLSQTISTTGDRIVLVALALLVTERTGSTADLGLVMGVYTAAHLVFVLFGGVWADRLPRHRIMLSTDLMRGSLHALLAVLILTDHITIWELVAIEALFGTAEAFFRPAFSGLVPQTVPEELIQEANALNNLTQTIAEFAGPAIATALVLTLGTGTAFAVDAGTFFVSACLLALVHPRPRGEPAPRRSVRTELREGFEEVRSRTWVWVTIVVFSFQLFGTYAPYVVLGPTVAEDRYGDPALYGWLAAAVGFGTAIGSLLALHWRPRRPLVAGILLVLPFCLLLSAYALGIPLALALVLGTTTGVGIALFGIWWQTALAERIPPQALSRVTSYDWLGSLALLPVGYVVIGVLADHIGAIEVMAGGGVLAASVLLLGLIPRATRELGQAGARVGAPPVRG
ncbi:MFS transporter [Conexibacter sp. CPCC 206217]|uniref:MFS transporter n=1 Tax=Conexibacter sp. CPCC 206217 TaxID=3064574 RepID=UPI0027256914|nr:MFS transporter [Conexibacter sp. CPCC 206217]MDO8210818.1 MFS transporter [Conexibacter sp. CPCC 206217]